MSLTLADAQVEVAARGFDYLEPPRLTFMLNNAKNALEDMWEWPWLTRLAIGAAPLLIGDLKLVTLVRTDDDRELYGLDVRQAAINGTDLTAPGTPEHWWLDDTAPTTVRTLPVGGGEINVLYICESPELSSPSDVPLIPARYQPLWIDLAVVEGYKDSDNYVAAQALRADVAMRVQDVILRYETRNRQHSPFITARVFSEDE